MPVAINEDGTVTVREQRIAKARRAFGLNKDNHPRGDQTDQAAAEDHGMTDVANALQLLSPPGEATARKALQRLHDKVYHCEPGRLQSLLTAVGVPARACSLVPQVVQVCQVCRPWNRPGQPNKFAFALAMSCHEEVQFDITFCHSELEPGVGGEKGIPITHLIDCCTRWSACLNPLSRSINDLLRRISLVWVNVFGGIGVFTCDGEIGMRGKAVGDWAMCDQFAIKDKAPHQTGWLVEGHNALIRSALQRAEAQAINETFCISSNIALGLVTFMHNALVFVNNRIPYQALLDRHPQLLPPFEGGYH